MNRLDQLFQRDMEDDRDFEDSEVDVAENAHFIELLLKSQNLIVLNISLENRKACVLIIRHIEREYDKGFG